MSWYCFHFATAICDTTAQLIHAKFIAAGHLYGQSHPLRQFFPVWMMVNDGKWYSQYQPLHIMLLALGYSFGTPWLVNPLEGALSLALIIIIAYRAYGNTTAKIAGLLTFFCQFMLWMSSEYMNHATSLLFMVIFLLCYLEMLGALTVNDSKRALRWAAAAGLGMGGVFLTRPFTAVGIGLPFVLYLMAQLRGDAKRTLAPFLAMAATGLICVALELWYNALITGDMFMFPTSQYHSANSLHALGIHDGTINWGYMFSKSHSEWVRLNVRLFEWSLPCTFFVMLLCLTPLPDLFSRLLLASLFSHTLVNLVNQFYNDTFGPRYLYELSPALILLTALSIYRLPLLMRRCGLNAPRSVQQGIVGIIIVIVIAGGVAFRFPGNLALYSNNYTDSHIDFYNSMVAQSTKPALIFMARLEKDDDPKDPAARNGWRSAEYRYVAHDNPPTDDAPIIFAYDLGDAENKKLMDYYPHRYVYIEHKGTLIPVETKGDKPAPVPVDKKWR